MQIWFGPKTWDIKPSGHGPEYTLHDFPAFIAPNAPWQLAMSRIAVLSLPGNIVWSYPDLPSLVAFVNRNHFKIAFGDGVLFNAGTCGVGVEGMSTDHDVNRETVKIAELWKRAGGRLDYLAMDSPYYFGHLYPRGCRYSIFEVARRAAATLRGVLAYFPNVKIVDAEGPGEVRTGEWLDGMENFLTAFRQQSQREISTIGLDLHWSDLRAGETWQDTARRSVSFFRERGVQAALIIDADGTAKNVASDAAWIAENRLHLRQAAEANIGLGMISIESWTNVPRRNLPENSPVSFTSLVNYAYSCFNRVP